MDLYKVIGVMSGTSLDGIDLTYIYFEKTNTWNFSIHIAQTIPYPEPLENQLREAIHYSKEKLKTFDLFYTNYLANTIQQFIEDHQISEIDAICSHGHTILHQPEDGITYQIGNLPELAKSLKYPIVCDFRAQDVALGGQGAPLVPIGDALLFSEYDYCLNLGGFANVSYHKNGKRIAYDICPVNIVLNKFARQMGFDYDDKGAIAKSGTYVKDVGDKLNTLPFYQQEPPKSLGLEWVQKEIFPKLIAVAESEKNILKTFTEHIAKQLASGFQTRSTVLVTGGGAYNDYLLSRIQFYKELNLVKPTPELIEYKEALIFGLLGVLRLRNEINCLKSVTGALKNHSSGKIFNLDQNKT